LIAHKPGTAFGQLGLAGGRVVLEILDKLQSLESAVTGTRLRAKAVDGGEDVTMLRLLDDADLEHGEEIVIVVPDENDD
jgi:hypothetical protein